MQPSVEKNRGTQKEKEERERNTTDESEEADSDVTNNPSLLPVLLPTWLFLDIQVGACFPTKYSNTTYCAFYNEISE